MDEKNRGSSNKCLLCSSDKLTKQTTLTSLFLSKRAWGGSIEWSDTNRCLKCGFIFHGRGLTSQEIENYYTNYRDQKYFFDRNLYEFFYTRKVHNNLESQMGCEARKLALVTYLRGKNPSIFNTEKNYSILDYGGGSGRFISRLPGKKFVFDISGEKPLPEIKQLSVSSLETMKFDLIICAQMLEHATDPKKTTEYLFNFLKPGGSLYIEVPYNETWTDYSWSGVMRNFVLSLAKKFKLFNILLDIYGTAFRVKLKILPPFAFVPVREHLNYFYPSSFIALAKAIGASIADVSREPQLGTVALFKKSLTSECELVHSKKHQ